MVDAYLFFYDQLSEFFLGIKTEPGVHADVPLADRLEECFQALKNSLQVVTIDLQQGDDPQVIFETLNARGEPLLPADLLRNYIFLRAARQDLDQEALYNEYWKRFDDSFWRVEVKQGRLVRPRSDLFMQHFLASRIGEDIPIKHLFVEYKNWIERKHPFASVKEELADLSRQGDHFRRLLAPEQCDVVYSISTFLDAFDIRTAYPLLLTLLDAEIDETTWASISQVLESYLVRRAVCAMNTKNYNRVFLQLARGLRRDGISVENLTKQIASQSGASVEWPSDTNFNRAWIQRSAYDLGNSRLVNIFNSLNGTYVSGKSESLSFNKQPTIEHIMPQEWIEHWPLPDGATGMDDQTMLTAEDDDPCAIASRRRDDAVQTFGNLTILMQSLNSSQSNSAWKDKRPTLLKYSLLSINQDLHNCETWNEDTIRTRGEQLFQRAMSIWPKAM